MTGTDNGIKPHHVGAAIWQWLQGVGQVLGGLVAFGFGTWAVIGDTVQDISNAPQKIAMVRSEQTEMARLVRQIELDLATLTGRKPVTPTVEFRGDAFVSPSIVTAGEKTTVVYDMRRNEDCSSKVEIRYYSLREGLYDPAHSRSVDSVRATVTRGFAPFKLKLQIPALLPGVWAYHPVIIPGPDCQDSRKIQPPMAWFEVRND